MGLRRNEGNQMRRQGVELEGGAGCVGIAVVSRLPRRACREVEVSALGLSVAVHPRPC